MESWRGCLLHAHEGCGKPEFCRALADELHRKRNCEKAVVGRRKQPGEDDGDAGGKELETERATNQDPNTAGRGDAERDGFGRLCGLKLLRLFLGDRYRRPVIGSIEKTLRSGPRGV